MGKILYKFLNVYLNDFLDIGDTWKVFDNALNHILMSKNHSQHELVRQFSSKSLVKHKNLLFFLTGLKIRGEG